jgi:hypothetical protein
MDQSLAYLREILSLHTENSDIGKELYDKLTNGNYTGEGQLQFVRELSEDEMSFLDHVLKEAIAYSKHAQDSERANHLNEVYELLFV